MFAANCSGVKDARPTRTAVVVDGERLICAVERLRSISFASRGGAAIDLVSEGSLRTLVLGRAAFFLSFGFEASRETGIGRLAVVL